MSDRRFVPDDPALPGLRTLFLEHGAPEVSVTAARRLLGVEIDAAAAEVTYLRYWPGRRCVVAWTFPPVDGRPVIISAELQPVRPEKRRKPDARQLYLEDERLLLQSFPHDDALPGIEAAVSPDWMQRVLAPALGLSTADAQTLRATPVSYKPWRRCVILYEGQSEGRAVRAYGKLFRDDRGAELYGRFRALEVALDSSNLGWHISPFLLYDPDLRLLVQVETQGPTLSDLLRHADTDGSAHARLLDRVAATAQGLPTFQNLDIGALETVGPEEMLAALEEDIASIALVDPVLAETLEGHRLRMVRLSERLTPEPLGLAHSALRLSHVYDTPDGLALLDLDALALSPVSADAGYFLAYLAVSAAERARLTAVLLECAAVFDEALGDAGSVSWRGFYTFMTVLKWAVRSFFSLDPDWPTRIEDMIGVGRVLLRQAREAGLTDPGAREPLFDIATNRETIFEFARDAILPALYGDSTFKDITVLDTAYTPGQECILLADLDRLDAAGKPHVDRLILTFVPSNRVDVSNSPLTPFALSLSKGEPPPSARVIPWSGGSCLVERFPHDASIPGLMPALQPDHVVDLLSQANETTTTNPFNAKVLRYRPHQRVVLRYDLANRRYVAKAYADLMVAREVFQALTALREQLSAPGLVVRPIALDTANGIVVTEHVEGVSLGALMSATTDLDEMRALTHRAAETIAALHALDLPTERRVPIDYVVLRLREHAAALRLVAPDLATRFDMLLDQVEAAAMRTPFAGPPSLVHGGFKPTQMIVNGDSITLLDFDGAALGDPALDLGRFMAKLRSDAFSRKRRHLAALPEYFVEAYEQATGRDLAARARIYEVTALLRMTSRHVETVPQSLVDPMKESASTTLLRAAEECAAELV